MRAIGVLLLTAWLGLFACATREVLETKSSLVPAGVDFSGYWTLRDESAAEQERIDRAIGRAAGREPDIFALPPDERRAGQRESARGSDSRRSHGNLVQVFLQSGKNLKITQNPGGIFISFDRSVVQEFRFGENREVSVGEIVAQRVSGWDGTRYVVESLDRNGGKLTETFYLADGGNTLHRIIVLRDSKAEDVTLNQSFSRMDRTD
jgi:hypothetical protein